MTISAFHIFVHAHRRRNNLTTQKTQIAMDKWHSIEFCLFGNIVYASNRRQHVVTSDETIKINVPVECRIETPVWLRSGADAQSSL